LLWEAMATTLFNHGGGCKTFCVNVVLRQNEENAKWKSRRN
jgi:hypothetical protein